MGIKEVMPEYNEFESSVADELRAQRKRSNVTQKEMSDRIGLHSNTIAKVERGEFGIGLDIIYGYSRVLNRPLEGFISKLNKENNEGENPVAELTGEEMLQYSQLVQSIISSFIDQGIKLSPQRSFDVTKLAALAIIDNRGH